MAADGTVAKRLTVSGPGYPRPRPEDLNPKAQTLHQDGRTGLFQHTATDRSQFSLPPEYYGWVWWTEHDGSAWYAQASGMTEAELLAAVKSLKVENDQLDTGHLPAGLTTEAPAFSGPSGDVAAEFHVGKKADISLMIHQIRDSSWQAGPGSRPITINGAAGWIKGGSRGERVWLDWPLAPGVIGSISGRMTTRQALAWARVTEKTSMADPRLKHHK
jgi:hypothetical protein